jgi:opine dehydrogenase
MSGEDIRAALEAISRRASAPAVPAPPLRAVAVLGAGPLGQLLAVEALAAGYEVRLFSAFSRELDALQSSGAITVRGRHLVGTYATSDAPPAGPRPAIRLCRSVDAAVQGADAVLVATPASVHSTYAGLLSPVLVDGQTVVLVPGRFLGSAEFARTLARHGCAASIRLAETAGSPYLVRTDGPTLIVDAVAARVTLAGLGGAADQVAAQLHSVWPMLEPAATVLESAFSGVTGVVGVAPVVLNTAAVQSEKPPLLRDIVTPDLSRTIIARLDDERRAVAFAYGVRELPSAAAELGAAYAVDGEQVSTDDLAGALAELSAFDEYPVTEDGGPHVRDDVPNMLVPLASAGRAAGVPTEATDALIALASVLTGNDFARHGRRLESLGLAGYPPHELRRVVAEAGFGSGSRFPWRRF